MEKEFPFIENFGSLDTKNKRHLFFSKDVVKFLAIKGFDLFDIL